MEKALFYFIKSQIKDDNNKSITTLSDSIRYLNEKATDNIALFQYILAKCYEYGIAMPKDYGKAMLWHQMAAENGFIESNIKLRQISTLSTKVSDVEISMSVTDEYGVVYTQDWKKVLSCKYLTCDCYKIRRGVRVIADGAFNNQAINKTIIPSSVILIGDNPFKSGSVRYKKKRAIIENYSYNYKVLGSALFTRDGSTLITYWGNGKHYAVPDGVTHIGNSSFSEAYNLETISFNKELRSIGKHAFNNCYALKSIDLPLSVENIGQSAFRGCESLNTIWSLGAVETIEAYTFIGCNLKHINLPNQLTKIKESAFKSNKELVCIDLPNSLEEIGDEAFAFCNKLEHIHIGDRLIHIGNFCFYECAINEIWLPSTIRSLGIRPFNNLNEIILKNDSVFLFKSGMLINQDTGNLVLYCGDKTILDLSMIKSISPLAFDGSNVKEIILPNSMRTISEYSFYGASKLNNITLPNRLNYIETGAFAYCKSLREIIIPQSVKQVRESSFYNCSSLQTIEFKGCNTKASESIIKKINHRFFPSGYRPDHVLMGSIITESCPRQIDIKTLEVIYIVVPVGAKDNYGFKPVYSSIVSDYNIMERNFIIVEHNDEC